MPLRKKFKTPATRRRDSREKALQLLFQEEFFPQKTSSIPFENKRPTSVFLKETEVLDEYTKSLLEGVKRYKREIDDKIRHFSQNWDNERMSLVDLNILRLALYEMESEKAPFPVAINEALDIAKKYSTQKSSSFINGILDQAMKRHKNEQEEKKENPL